MAEQDITITWRTTNEGVNWADLAVLLNRSFAVVNSPVNKPGFDAAEDARRRQEEWETAMERARQGQGRTAASVERVFTASYGVIYAYDGDRVIACGRVLSDGLEQAAIYNIGVDPDYQGYGLGRRVIEGLLEQVPGCEVILYTHPQTVKFYETLGWRRMKTGFVIHPGRDFSPFEIGEGFILPEGYRYEQDESEYYGVPAAARGESYCS